jgi:hypothetical protein
VRQSQISVENPGHFSAEINMPAVSNRCEQCRRGHWANPRNGHEPPGPVFSIG